MAPSPSNKAMQEQALSGGTLEVELRNRAGRLVLILFSTILSIAQILFFFL